MIEEKITVTISPAIKKLFDNPGEVMRKSIWSGMVNLVEEIEARAKKEAPVRTSNLMRSITSSASADGLKGQVEAGAKYAEYVHRGTGLFGPFKKKIVPITKKALFWPGATHPVKWVKGMRPNPFFDRAIAQVKPQSVFEEGMENYLKREGLG